MDQNGSEFLYLKQKFQKISVGKSKKFSPFSFSSPIGDPGGRVRLSSTQVGSTAVKFGSRKRYQEY
jgi:hypothetical protein